MSITTAPNLWQLKTGQQATIAGFDKSLDKQYRQRVEELGFCINTQVRCIKSPAFGAPKVYCVNNAVFALENMIASLMIIAE